MRNVHIVYGPPSSGKTTYVNEHARPGDITIDWDKLAQDAGSPKTHDHAREYAQAASRRRMELEREVERMTTGTAWIIRTLPNPQDREDIAERLQADLIRCDPGGNECIRRAHEAGRPPSTDELIIRWYATDWGARALTARTRGGTLAPNHHPGLT